MKRAEQALPYDGEPYQKDLREAVADVVRKQADTGLDIPSDGEFGKRGWVHYVTDRLTGIEYAEVPGGDRYSDVIYFDRERFAGFYAGLRQIERTQWLPDWAIVKAGAEQPRRWICTGKIGYRGTSTVSRDIENMKAALKAAGVTEGFLPCAAPCSVEIFASSDAYQNEEEYLYAVADALRNEYRAVVDSGLLLQLDDAVITMHYSPAIGVEEYLKWVALRIEVTNYALQGIPADRVRYHICWGSQNAPHTWDVPLKYLVEPLLKLNVGALAIEAGNPRHEHEWQVWQDVTFPADKILIPGVISHSTNVVEHPELVAWRINNFVRLLGRERVIAGTDCGFSQNWNTLRVHEEVQWAKLETLVEGARLASAAVV